MIHIRVTARIQADLETIVSSRFVINLTVTTVLQLVLTNTASFKFANVNAMKASVDLTVIMKLQLNGERSVVQILTVTKKVRSAI